MVSKEMLADPDFDPSVQNNEGILQAGVHKHQDIVNLLLKNEKVIRGFYESRLKHRLPDETEEDEYGDGDDLSDEELEALEDELPNRPGRLLTDRERLDRLLRISREEMEAEELSDIERLGWEDEAEEPTDDEDEGIDPES